MDIQLKSTNGMIESENESENESKRNYFILFLRGLVFITGILVLSLGASTAITASLGVPTWDVLHIGLANKTPFSIGRWVQIIGVSMILMTAFLEKEKPSLGSIVNIIMIGFFMNLILESKLLPVFDGFMPRTMMLLSGITLMGFGSGMYVSSKFGAGPREGLTLFISKRFSMSIRLSRTIIEVIALTIGWLLGGPVALGTFTTVILIGPIMQFSLKFWTNQIERISVAYVRILASKSEPLYPLYPLYPAIPDLMLPEEVERS
ncbi:YczE/YyaS/YitT family protein [Heliophilum fasciatum]|nr:hypothetical protein [Heliophilum fasciatum]MCW2276777.1 putative membrane protein YczE [Heliophilum fasciatum]